VLIVGMFMSILDISIVNVAIPTIQSELGVTTEEVQWVTTAYSLALGVVVPISGWLGDRYGLTRVYTLSLLGFAAGSALCGLAWDLQSLVGFRILQAVGGGILPVVTLAMVYRIVPRQRIGAAMGFYGLGIVFAPAIGPALGGYLVEYVDWRLIFTINVPIGILGAIAAVLVLPRFAPTSRTRLDVLGFLTAAGGLFALLLALSKGESWGWTSYPTLILVTFAVLSLALFVIIELEVEHPLIDLRVFRYWQFTNSLLLITVISVGLFAVLFYIPLFLQQAQQLGALATGLTLLPQALVMGMIMPFAGRLYDRIGPRWPAVVGLSIVAIGTYLMHDLALETTRGEIIFWTCFRSVGVGLAMMSIMTGGIAVIPDRLVSQASALNNIVQRTSAALGLAVLTALLTSQQLQQFTDRADLIPAVDPGRPELAALAAQGPAAMLAFYQRVQLASFVGAMDDVLLVTAVASLIGVALAFFLRSGPIPAAGGAAAPTAAAVAEGAEPSADGVAAGSPPARPNGRAADPAGRPAEPERVSSGGS
jgi:EmrB/QacA subfamily drug resistance transporter